MPTSTYDLIASNVLTSSASSVTFSGISGSYRDLVLVIDTGSSPEDYFGLRFNSDTGTNYPWVAMGGTGSSALSTSWTGGTNLRIGHYSYPGSTRSLFIAHIMDYSATDKHKTVISRGNRASLGVEATAGRWASTSAITSITILQDSGNLSSGGTFYLYGIVS